jgi:NTP pyrophosphatase (non-canonical NTP hydrolase)
VSKELTFKDYQEFAKETDMYPVTDVSEEKRVWLVEYRTLCINGEVGELSEKMLSLLLNTIGLSTAGGKLANKVKKIRRDYGIVTEEVRAAIVHEIGDILWYLSTLCTIIDEDLSEVARLNIKVLSSRKERGVIKGKGDNR